MDIDEWEFLPDGGYLDFNEVGGGENQIFFEKRNSVSKSVLDMNYFCTSPKSKRINPEAPAPWNHHHHYHQHQRIPSKQQLVHVPIQLEPRFGNPPKDEALAVKQEEEQQPQQKDISTSTNKEDVEQDMVSQVFFKIKDNEFADMKLDSPKSGSRGFYPAIDAGEMVTSPRMKKIEKKEMMIVDCDKQEEEEEGKGLEGNPISDDDGFNIWKWGLTGVGAIFSFGVAAATICVLFFGNQKERNKLHQEHKIRFQIYTDDKRLKQVVQHATKLNEAISAVRGVPMSRAHITYGGYYDGL